MKKQSNKGFYVFLVLLWVVTTIAFWYQNELNNAIQDKIENLKTDVSFSKEGGISLEDNLDDVRTRVKDLEYNANQKKIDKASDVVFSKYWIYPQFVRILDNGNILFEFNNQDLYPIEVSETSEGHYFITSKSND